MWHIYSIKRKQCFNPNKEEKREKWTPKNNAFNLKFNKQKKYMNHNRCWVVFTCLKNKLHIEGRKDVVRNVSTIPKHSTSQKGRPLLLRTKELTTLLEVRSLVKDSQRPNTQSSFRSRFTSSIPWNCNKFPFVYVSTPQKISRPPFNVLKKRRGPRVHQEAMMKHPMYDCLVQDKSSSHG